MNNKENPRKSQKNYPKQQEVSPKKNLLLAFKTIIWLTLVSVVTLSILYFMDLNSGEPSYFTEHFAISIILILIGIIAIILPKISKETYSGSDRGDNFMVLVGVLLILSSFISIFFSYI